ncbi:MAG: 50S ribosomal protein L10, partial [Gemmatimonadetes bacterium]|nr:50S ribosomal protein L10 [Gemmatimonadota bacterium]
MPTERKVKEVEALTERFSSASMVIATDYRGIPVQ